MDITPSMRSDKRTALQIRPIAIEQGLLNRADGSARFSQGRTSVIAAVYGPIGSRPAAELIDRAHVEVTVKPASGLAGLPERSMETQLQKSLEHVILTKLHPRTTFSVVVQVMHDDGSLLSTCLNAATLALLDAGVEMIGVLASCTCATTADGTLFVDPLKDEELKVTSCMTFAYLISQVMEASRAKRMASGEEKVASLPTQATALPRGNTSEMLSQGTASMAIDHAVSRMPTAASASESQPNNSHPPAALHGVALEGDVILSHMTGGAVSPTTYFESLQLCRRAALNVVSFIRMAQDKKAASQEALTR